VASQSSNAGGVAGGAGASNGVEVKGYMDLTQFISKSGCEGLNESESHTLEHLLSNTGKFLQSDTDEQLILYLTFNQVVKLHSLKLQGPPDNGPKTVKLFINQTNTPNFDACEATTAVQEFKLSPEDITAGALISLKYVKFQNVNSLTIFIKDNQSGSDVTRIDHLGIIGNPVVTTNMNEFKRVAGKPGEAHG